jgi:gluconate 2-dehydrogenase alpha chain
MRKLPHKDVVIIGLGWTGSIMAHELTDEGLDVVAIERGPWRDAATDFPPNYDQDELRYRIRHELFLRPDQTTFTFRNKMDQTALPIRTWGAFMPPNGVGGGGVHWNAETWRFLPSDFVLKTHLTERYGAGFLPPDMTIQDWGVTYDEIEPYYDRFEYLCGTSGQAGNLKGQILEGGNPFEGPRSRPYPNPPQAQPFSYTLFAKAARELGYKPFPQPSGNMSQAYRNPLGVRLGPCTYCGFCEWFGCGNNSKSSPQTTILPVLVRKSNFLARDNCEVTRINTDGSGKRATGVTFVDTSGEEWEQPADLVILSAYTVFNVQLLLLSGIGKPYDPVANQGVIGRNYSHQTISDVTGFFDKAKFNSTRSSPRARSACVSTNSTATISIMVRTASSAAAIWARSRPTGVRLRRRPSQRERRAGAPSGSRRCATTISARSSRGPGCTAASTATATSISTSTRPTRIGSAARSCG